MLRTLSFYLTQVNKLTDPVAIAQSLNTVPFNKDFLKLLFCLVFKDDVKWDLPPGVPPYTPADHNEEALIYGQFKKFHRFDKAADPTLPSVKREMLFINMLEYVHKDDAKLLIAIKDKTWPYQNITPKVVYHMFPELGIGENFLTDGKDA